MENDVVDQEHVVESDSEPPPPSPTPLDDVVPEHPKQLDLATQARLEALLEAAGIVSSSQEARRALADPEILRRLTTSVSSALDEAAATLSRIRAENDTRPASTRSSLAEACANGDYAAVSRFLTDRKGLQDLTQEESESLLSLACSAGYYELAQVLVSMRTAKEGVGALKHDSTPLMEAASGGYVEIVKLLNDNGAEVNAQSEAGNTALTYAACGGYEDVVQVLLDAGARIEEQNESGHTALMEAASAGHIGVAKLLLTQGANINTHSNEFKESALTLAAYKGHADMVCFLLENGADMDHKTDEMHNALMEACMDGHVEVARVLLDHGALVNMPADSFESPLTLAACGGHIELAALLISRGANLEEFNDEGYTPLMEAAREGNDVVQLLVENGANVNAITDETQETALTLSCCGGLLEVSRYLLEHNADIELGASTPLMEAAQEGHADLVNFLLEKGAAVDATTATNDTALTFACANGHTDVGEILLLAGAELEHKSEGGRTPLMKAARAGHLSTVEFLISKGASVNMRTTNNDHTVLSLASAGGHLPIVMLLLQQGADPAHLLKDSSTPLIETSKGGHVHVAALLLEQGYTDSRVLPPAAKGTDVKELPGNSGGSVKGKQKKKQKALPSPQVESKVKIPKVAGPADGLPPGRKKASHNKQWSQSQSSAQKETHRSASSDISSVAAASFVPLDTLPTPESIFPFHQMGNDQHSTKPAALPSPHQPSAFTGSTALVPSSQPLVAHHPQPVAESPRPTSPPLASQLMRELPLSPRVLSPYRGVSPASPSPLAVESLAVVSSSQAETTTSEVANRKVTERRSPEGSSCHNEMASTTDVILQQTGPAQLPSVKPFTFTGASTAAHSVDEEESFNFSPELVTESLAESTATTNSLTKALLKDPLLVQNLIEDYPGLRELFQEGLNDGRRLDTDVAADVGEPVFPVSYRELMAARDMRSEVLHAVPPPSPTSGMSSLLHNPEDEDMVLDPYAHMHSRVAEDATASDQMVMPPLKNMVPHVPAIDIEMQTESTHDTALTLAAGGGHDELVDLLLDRGADLEHKDKKGCSPLILASTAGHATTSELLLQHCADIEAQSDRTKDTALSLACSGGRQEVVEVLLNHGANFEHRNMSDYTPLSLAASGGYVGIIKLLLQHGAEINSRTGSKLGISPLMLAAMNGHTAAVKLLLDMGSDINAQIETNRNTALTLACFQGRHEVVSLLVDRKANVEHRAKTGLTPLMEAASGGYVEVGKVLLERGADVNAPPVPSSKDTALTIAADKGHAKFVELLLDYQAHVDVHNKKGASPLWLACNGGHWEVVQHLINAGADPDAEDNRGFSCIVAAFRRGHTKVVKYMVKKVTRFPNDADGTRFMSTMSDKELLKRCKQCMEIIVTAKDRQAAEANKHATILLQELDQERTREENRKAAAARKRSKRRRQKQKKKEEKDERDRLRMQPRTAPDGSESESDKQTGQSNETSDAVAEQDMPVTKVLSPTTPAAVQVDVQQPLPLPPLVADRVNPNEESPEQETQETQAMRKSITDGMEKTATPVIPQANQPVNKPKTGSQRRGRTTPSKSGARGSNSRSSPSHEATSPHSQQQGTVSQSPRRAGKRSEEGWKEVVRKVKRIAIPGPVVSRVMGRSGTNIVAIRQASGAHIDVERGRAGQDRMVTIRGNTDAIRIASNILTALMKEPDCDMSELLPGKQSAAGGKRGGGTSVVGGVAKVQPPQPLQQEVGLMRTKSQTGMKTGQAVQSQPTKQAISQPVVSLPQPQAMPSPSKPSIQAPTSQPNTNQPSPPSQSKGVKRQLFSTAAAPKTSQARATSLTGPAVGLTTKDLLQQKISRSASVPVTVGIPTSLAISSLFSQVAQTRSPSVWSTASSQTAQLKPQQEESQPPTVMPSLPGSSAVGSAVSSLAVSTVTPPLSHFEPLITQTRSASSSKGPSPAPSSRAASPHLMSPGAIGQRETKTIAPIGTERAQETSQEKQEKQSSPSPSTSSDKQEGRQTPAPIGTGRSQQQLQHQQKQLKQSDEGGGSIKPIGTERASRRSGTVPTAIVNPGFPSGRPQSGLNPQPGGVWGYPVIRSEISVPWAMQSPPVPSSASVHPHVAQHGGAYGNSTRSRSLESLASLLDRLSLSKHLNLFQMNEIDLDALMLMSEKDYAEIGLPKGPRMKLLNATGRLDEGFPPEQVSSQSPVGTVPVSHPPQDRAPGPPHRGAFPPTAMPSTIAVAASRAWASVPPVQTAALMGNASTSVDNSQVGQQSKGQQPSGDGTGQVGWKRWDRSV